MYLSAGPLMGGVEACIARMRRVAAIGWFLVLLYGFVGTNFVVTVDAAPGAPSPPTATAATNINSSSFVANWSSVSGATGYELDVATSGSFTGSSYVSGYRDLNVGNVTSRSVTGLNANTPYYYRVRAYNARGTSGNSNVISVTTLPNSTPTPTLTHAPRNVHRLHATS